MAKLPGWLTFKRADTARDTQHVVIHVEVDTQHLARLLTAQARAKRNRR